MIWPLESFRLVYDNENLAYVFVRIRPIHMYMLNFIFVVDELLSYSNACQPQIIKFLKEWLKKIQPNILDLHLCAPN